jgi:MFS family permease
LLRVKPPRVFYGWWVVAGSFLISVYVGGTVFYGFTAFIEPITRELGWSYAQVSLAASLRGLEAGLLAPLFGVLADRWGSRRLILFGSITAAAGMLLLSRSNSLAVFYGSFALLSLGTSSCTGIVVLTAVANWFQRRVGLANAIALCGFGFSGLLIPAIVGLIDLYNWRTAFLILAVGMIVVNLPLSALFRHRPEQYGYLPDGAEAGGEDQPIPTERRDSSSETISRPDTGTRQAVKSRTFWSLVLLSLCHMMVMSATIVHVMPYLGSIGVDRSTSGIVAAAIPVASIAGRLLFGWLGDYLSRQWALVGAFVAFGLGTLCFGLVSVAGFWFVVPFVLLFGIGYGGSNSARISLAREYFGRTNFGSIFGLVMGLSVLGSIVAPPLAGWVYDTWGTYKVIWFVYAALPFAVLATIPSFPKAAR